MMNLFKIANIYFLKPFIQITAKSIVETNYEYVYQFKQIKSIKSSSYLIWINLNVENCGYFKVIQPILHCNIAFNRAD